MSKATRRFYVDTSSYLCVLFGEEGHATLRDELEGAELLSSVLLLIESERNIVRIAREGIINAEEFTRARGSMNKDFLGFTFRDVTANLCTNGEMPSVSTPRSLDLIHLRTALSFHREKPLTRFVTNDKTLENSARELSLPV